jgi:recombination protein RecA
MIRPVMATGIENLDRLLHGGLPVGAVTELVGAECTGRTSIALSYVARMTEANKLCAWIDVSNAFSPASAAAMGIDLQRLLWVRCGVVNLSGTRLSQRFILPEKYLIPAKPKKGLHGGGFGPHPRSEAQGLSDAVGKLMCSEAVSPYSETTNYRPGAIPKENPESKFSSPQKNYHSLRRPKQFDSIECGLRSADLLIQVGGFSAIVLDLGSVTPEFVSRIDLSTWHRYRVAAEKTQSSILLLTQYPCARSSSELQLRLRTAEPITRAKTVFIGMQPYVEISRQRFTQAGSNVVPLRRQTQEVRAASWQNYTTWAARR